MDNYIKSKEELYQAIAEDKDIYIYGAGRAGVLVMLLLKEISVIPKAFLVSEKKQDINYRMDVPVYTYQNEIFNINNQVIVAALKSNQEEILQKCRDVSQKIIITEEFFGKYIDEYSKQIEDIFFYHNMTLYRRSVGEERIYKNSFLDIDWKNDVFLKKFYSLVKELSYSDCQKIEKTIQRINVLKSCSENAFDFFSKEEKRKILEGERYISENKIKLSKSKWKCGKYYLPIDDFRMEIFYDRLGLDEVENLECYRDKDIIDVGGYIGDSSLILSDYTNESVHVFEPMRSNFELLLRTKELNLVNMQCVNKAVSSENGFTSFMIGENEFLSGISEIGERKYKKQVMVETIALDKYVYDNHLKIGIIKIHAEGEEQNVIRGAKKTIAEQSPILIIEINHTESDFFDIKPMIEKINPRYKFKIFKPSNRFVCLGLKLIAEVR